MLLFHLISHLILNHRLPLLVVLPAPYCRQMVCLFRRLSHRLQKSALQSLLALMINHRCCLQFLFRHLGLILLDLSKQLHN